MKIIQLLLACLLLTQCAVHRPSYHHDVPKDGHKIRKDDYHYSLFLIGDAGGKGKKHQTKKVLDYLEKRIKKSKEKTGVVFLGDNIYPNGLPEKDKKGRKKAEKALEHQIKAVKKDADEIFFIPGNHDWIRGRDAILRQEHFVNKMADRKHAFFPKNACGGPEIIKISDDAILMILDTQWWMMDWDDENNINDGCAAHSRTEFIDLIYGYFKKYQEKHIIVAAHHPMTTNGSHGGYYDLKEALFPLTSFADYLYLPLPVIGPVLRSSLGMRQDLTHPMYSDLINRVITKAKGFNNIVFVGGHEHNLQYASIDGHPQIVSGAGSKRTAARSLANSKFTYGEGGFVELRFYDDHSVRAIFYSALKEKILYETEVRPSITHNEAIDFSEYENHPLTKVTAIYSKEDMPSNIQRSLWGDLNRSHYYKEVEVPVFYLDEVKGGLKPIQKGGGNQTNSIRVANENGKQYVLRSMQKDGNRLAGGVLKGTAIVDIMKDVFTFSHPFAAFVVPELADAVGVYHTNPQLVYLPKQPSLDRYNENFGGGLYLFEERPAHDQSDVASFGNSDMIISTPDLMVKLQDKTKNQVDEPFVLRNRLFDMVIGDWDRHSDQWRWARFDNGDKGHIYRPIPRDRDQPFSKFDGLAPQIINKTVPLARQFQSYGPTVKRMKWYNFYARFFDARFTGSLTWVDWEKEILHIQNQLTDEVIESTIRQLPETVFNDGGEQIIGHMKTRRDGLMEIGRRYYEMMAKHVNVVATRKNEIIHVHHVDEGTTVEVFDNQGDQKGVLLYKREFLSSETKEIRIYGLSGDDYFIIEGEGHNSCKVRIIGGKGNDLVEDKSTVSGRFKSNYIYDHPEGMRLFQSKETASRLSNQTNLNEFDHREVYRNYIMKSPAINYNPDDGLSIGANFVYHHFGFKKQPYAGKHEFTGLYAFNTEGSIFTYNGEFINVIKRMDVTGAFLLQGPRYAINFFGLGNNTQNEIDDEAFNQVRQARIMIEPGLRIKSKNGSTSLSLNFTYDRMTIEDSDDRFISQEAVRSKLPEYIFDNLDHVGSALQFEYDNRDNESNPSQGMIFLARTAYTHRLDEVQNTGQLDLSLSLYHRVAASQNMIWATKFVYSKVFGEFDFYQSAALGRTSGLRGVRDDRYRGESVFSNQNDLRIKIGKIRNRAIPINFGIVGSFDHGRVFYDDVSDLAEYGEAWHYSYGGALSLDIMGLLTINTGYYVAKDDRELLIHLGYQF